MTQPDSEVRAVPGPPVYADMRGKVAVVTGGSRGVGAATCLALARNGVRVAINGRDEEALQSSVAAVRACGAEVLAIRADCSDLAQVRRMRDAVLTEFGAPDFVLAFAGGGTARPVPVHEISEEDWRSSLDHNLTSTFFTLKCFLPDMLARGSGGILTMASAGGRMASGAPAGYGAAKAGVIMLTRHLAQEAGPAGVRVNCISPSAVLTERTRANLPPERQAQMLPAFPLGRLGTPEDIAQASLFLLSDASSWVTGIVLDVAGGRVMV
ncbi:SDR family NAD(P)-dependent oxidoreductase [Achromobacter anxifer]|uniref:SDR family NAD(P)-dependent oxidoreductase n=1 Tax=Achromobacter anxifer TaxID=1287737 RepID=UPI00155D1271|nr:SDR family NAD(P)-dependent oxidoreductase [Achromobacter anxifer]MDF8365370.1 SDR family NAD(P)-dependent oxidoreductase [Achromobacter anxifer]CAB5512539.1 3-oxoacyl-[acyl-carrier-protein] reductase FabG [Achromobacter anxifer]